MCRLESKDVSMKNVNKYGDMISGDHGIIYCISIKTCR